MFTIQDVAYRFLSVAVDIFISDEGLLSLFIVSENRFLKIAGDHDDAPCCRGDRVKSAASSLRGLVLGDVASQMQSYAADFHAVYKARYKSADLLRGAWIAALASCAPLLTEQAVASVWARWTLVCDLDEFFVFDTDRFRSIGDYLAWVARRHTDVITLSWGFVGPSHHVGWTSDHIIDRFQSAPRWGDNVIKSIFRTNISGQSYAHFPIPSSERAQTFRNAVGDVRTSMKAEVQHHIWGRSMDDDPVTSMAFICHYYYKSAEEFIVKHTRNRGDYPRQAQVSELVLPPFHLRTFLTLFDQPDERWPVGNPRRCAPDVHSICATMRAIASIADAEAHVRSLYQQRRHQLVASVVETPAFQELGEDARGMMELLGRLS